MDITKEQFRKKCLQKHKKNIPNRHYLDAKVNKKIGGVFKKLNPRSTILLYIPLPIEANITKTITQTRKKHTVLVPFMEEKSFKVVQYRLPLKRKRFGIYEAGNSYKKFKKIDVAVVPAVGIDKDLKRIGFGKGMYDRFFKTLKQRPYTIFIQRKLCYTKKRLCDEYDIFADIVIAGDGRLEKRM